MVNAAVAEAAKTDLLTDWVIAQGERVMGAATPADVLKAWREYHTRDVSPLVTQDVLLMAGTTDLAIPFPMLGEQLLTLTAARSVTARVFTEAEQASNHCQIGNTGPGSQGDPRLAGRVRRPDRRTGRPVMATCPQPPVPRADPVAWHFQSNEPSPKRGVKSWPTNAAGS